MTFRSVRHHAIRREVQMCVNFYLVQTGVRSISWRVSLQLCVMRILDIHYYKLDSLPSGSCPHLAFLLTWAKRVTRGLSCGKGGASSARRGKFLYWRLTERGKRMGTKCFEGISWRYQPTLPCCLSVCLSVSLTRTNHLVRNLGSVWSVFLCNSLKFSLSIFFFFLSLFLFLSFFLSLSLYESLPNT